MMTCAMQLGVLTILNSETHLTRDTSEFVRTGIEMVAADHPDPTHTVDLEAGAGAGISEFPSWIELSTSHACSSPHSLFWFFKAKKSIKVSFQKQICFCSQP